ncbi:hypothetical protein I553_3361 [Mycobacterium xenopi 4042]|uniref:Uncharacterized protein n=1 Tax=Mycobacterium xenopi 4042 TaxID=1299334 RepID=X8DD60_MYCXE|nr:hypothetical protein I553_3361 [Mycobacterium xenopi 4042]
MVAPRIDETDDPGQTKRAPTFGTAVDLFTRLRSRDWPA